MIGWRARLVLGVAAGLSLSDPACRPVEPTRWDFDSDRVGSVPAGAAAFTGAWAVRAEADAPSPPNVLCQTADANFPALSLGDVAYTDFVMTARFKPISGRIDQAAGMIFRVQDERNYYILRANALEQNVNLYLYVDGRRTSLKVGSEKGAASGRWQELRVEVRGNTFKGFLDGQPVVEASDGSYSRGQIGLWTKDDSVTCFDDVEVRSL